MAPNGNYFCKQKTAYEVRISDGSSDVGSSDLPTSNRPPRGRRGGGATPSPSMGEGRDGGERIAMGRRSRRSEEHTSELQSLMRISYAVFCLKKQNIPRLYFNHLSIAIYITSTITLLFQHCHIT